MSRMTAAQVISLGAYLNDEFDPGSLTVPQLLGVLGFHNIKYPTQYNKSKLVQLFNDEIKTKAAKLRKERLRKESSRASDDGITDGLTGMPIGGTKTTLVRRTSKRLSRAPAQDQASSVSPVRPDPPKRRRSSAQPNLGGPPRKAVQAQPTLMEESELEEDELPIRKVGRNNKSTETAGSQARRFSQAVGEDSGWEDNNIFQSGAESSSPARPHPVKPKTSRRGAVPRKSRKSSSAPPQFLPSSPVHPASNPPNSPPQSKFEPILPPSVVQEPRLRVGKSSGSPFPSIESRRLFPLELRVKDDDDDELNLTDATANEAYDALTDELKEEMGQEYDRSYDQTAAVSSRIAEGVKLARGLQIPPSSESKPMPFILRLLLTLITLATSAAVINYKMESAPIGYCDTGSTTNSALEELKVKWNAIEECNTENRTLLYLSSLSRHIPGVNANEVDDADAPACPPLPLSPLPYPDVCTPCPDHGTCTQHAVTCNTGYLLRPHSVLFFLAPPPQARQDSLLVPLKISSVSDFVWNLIAVTMDGLPGFGPVAFPPQCLEDPKRKRNIGALGRAVEAILGQERGKRLCAGVETSKVVPSADGGEARKWGVEMEKLKDALRKKTSPHLMATFDDTFNEAMQQLIQWGGVFIGEDSQGNRYLAHKTPDLTWNCVITVKVRELWAEWQARVFGLIATIVLILLWRSRRARQVAESRRVGELVQIVLDTLRNQELAHYTDPITAPQPYLSSLQLRDLILQDEHSIPQRRRLWDRVERVVESNANVRANLEEVRGGDEMRVWRWVGSAGRGPDARKRVQFEQERIVG